MNEQSFRRTKYLRQKIEVLTRRKHKLLALASSSQSSEAREAWAQQLDSTLKCLGKYSAELAVLEGQD